MLLRLSQDNRRCDQKHFSKTTVKQHFLWMPQKNNDSFQEELISALKDINIHSSIFNIFI